MIKKQFSVCQNALTKKGFTLVELLTVIAIIGILASVVLVSTQSSVEKAKRSSALTSASSALPELVTCADDGGVATTTVPGSTKYICCNASDASACVTPTAGHATFWPSLGTTGWNYTAPTGTIANGDYVYTITKTGQANIVCNMATSMCN